MNLAECSRLLCSRSAYDWIEGLHETEAGGTAVYKVRWYIKKVQKASNNSQENVWS